MEKTQESQAKPISPLQVGYLTFSSRAEAEEVCSLLVKKKLIACANIFSEHLAIYEWDHKVERSQEVGALIKTSEECLEELKAELVKLHSYDTPCLITWHISNSHQPFEHWVLSQVKGHRQ